MNAEQKKIALECIRLWGSEDLSDCAGDQMAALLQELIDAPEPEPVAWMVKNGFVCSAIYLRQKDADNYAADQQKRHDLSGSLAAYAAVPLYTAPPAPSAPDEELQAAFDRGLKAGNEQKEAQQVEIHRLHDLLAAAPQPPRLSDERILEIWARNSGRPVTMGKARIIAQARAIEREILGGNE